MGLFDLPAPLLGAIDSVLALALPPLLRLAFWAVFAGWLTMAVYRRFSNQEKIRALKTRQKQQQAALADFDGEFAQLLPLVRGALALGFRQLGVSLGPALLATLPVLFIVIWVAGEYAYEVPAPGSEVIVRAEPSGAGIAWSPATGATEFADGWVIKWPAHGDSLAMNQDGRTLLALPAGDTVPVIHKKRWWNLLMANPLGYLPGDVRADIVHIELPAAVFIDAGPDWMRGWMFCFFGIFLLSSIVFKLLMRLD